MSGTDNPEQFEVLKQQKEIIEQGIDLYVLFVSLYDEFSEFSVCFATFKYLGRMPQY